MKSLLFVVALVSVSCFLAGCRDGAQSPNGGVTQQDGDHDHDHGHDHGHDHPETFAEAVAELAETRDTIKAALAENDLRKADGPVHAVGHLLEDLSESAAEAGLSEEQLETVKTARYTLFESFAAIDETIHGKESGKSWDEVGSDIDDAIASLQAINAPGETEGSTDEEGAAAEGTDS